MNNDMYQTRLDDLIKVAKKYGASAADAVLSSASSVSVARRLGKQESLTRSDETEIGLRVFVGKRQAIVSSSDIDPAALQSLAERAVAMARCVPEDNFAGIADAGQLATAFPDLDLYDATEPDVATLNTLADEAERTALDIAGVTNSDSASMSFGKDKTFFAASNGFSGHYASSGFSLSVSVIAGEGSGMETDYHYDSSTYFCDLMPAAAIGREAGLRAVRSLNPRKVSTQNVPVVFDQRLAGGMIGSLASAISGHNVARGTTLLKDKMGEMLFAKDISVIDDPFLKRGARSHPFDAEGLAPQKRAIIHDGMLTGWLLDLAAARQLNLTPTGNAARGTSSPPMARAANFYMQPGSKTAEELIKDIDSGFFVTRLMGSGANIITGDYSRGASGFWIEKGQIAYPVSEITIAGNIKDMWKNLTPANDLKLKTGMDAPTLRIESMMVAGMAAGMTAGV